ncbi:UPF0182 family protein [Candidatus Roizmanbacteria bacterium]|nr:UPF0182 family protein [Candidatus Roizmanbacteria bacterium]
MSIIKFFSVTLLIVVFLVFIFFSSLVSIITDWWWYQEVGFTEIFVKSLSAKAIIGFGVGVFSAVFLISNLYFAASSKVPWIVSIPEGLVGQRISINDRVIRKLGIGISIVIALLIGSIASGSWQDILKFLSATDFGKVDPLFGKDISFYVFTLPIYFFAIGFVKTLVILSLVLCGVIYTLSGRLNLSNILGKSSKSQIDRKSTAHIGILLFLFLATIAVDTQFSIYNLLTSQSGPVFGASFTDANIVVPILRISVFVYGFASLLSLFYAFTGRVRSLVGAIVITLLVGFASGIIPAIYQKLIVAPNELAKETPFIKYNIDATNKAYGLDKVEEREIVADKPITAADIDANNLTIKNVRLWDRDPLLSTFSQIQEIRTYYEFASVDNDRYLINNELRQIMLSSRELAADSLPNKNWINERLTFTHGYGIAAGPVNQVTPEGLPVLFIKDIPPKSEIEELSVGRPEIYYGELVNDYVIVKTKSREFDYPKGEENVYTIYSGRGGVEINSPLRRLMYALRFGSLKLFLSSDVVRDSRILYYRNILERVERIAPFITFDRDPYLVVDDGSLYWILDGYTSTDSYPYSQPLALNGGSVNYIRNSVKAVVDAYDGTVKFYQADIDDPIIKTYANIFPKTFHKLSDMPKGLVPHLRYPEDIFVLQTAIYTIYHMDDPQIFYNKEDQWEVPEIAQEGETGAGGGTPVMTPRHMIMKLPGEKKEEFILMLPFTPRAKDNLSAWMVARNDGQEYGKLVVYRFPKDKLVFGPKQIIGRINQDAEISRQISLWDQRGSQVIQGPLLVIPIEESLLYVRPLYLKADAGKIPELKRVIVAYENKIAMEETLEEGLADIFGASLDDGSEPSREIPAEEIPTDTTKEGLLKQASEAYDASIRAQKEGDWARYGEEIKRLGEILSKLQE